MADSRIAAIAELVIKDERAADIGTDHAKLALYMLSAGIVPYMIISDLNNGPFNRALETVAASLYSDKIEVRQGNGLTILKQNEVFNVILAGMGGDTIVEILSFDLEKARSFKHYVLQPMSKPQAVRRFLSSQGWPILQEQVVKEKEHLFVIISTCPGEKRYELTPLQMDVGPHVLENYQLAAVKEYLLSWLKKYRVALAGLESTDITGSKILKKQYEEKISKLKEILSDG